MPDLRFASSRGAAPPVTLSAAIRQGLAPDGGLYIPTRLPAVDPASVPAGARRAEVARIALGGFFDGDALYPKLGRITEAALDIPAPTTAVRRLLARCRCDSAFWLASFSRVSSAFSCSRAAVSNSTFSVAKRWSSWLRSSLVAVDWASVRYSKALRQSPRSASTAASAS